MITELDNFRHATEVLPQGDHTTERRLGEVVNRGLPVVEMVVRDILQVGRNQSLHVLYALAYGVGCHLLFVTDDDMLAPKIERGKCRRITLAGLIDDDDIELRLARVEALIYSAQWYNPHRHRTPGRSEQLSCLPKEFGNAFARAFADFADSLHETHQGLLCLQASALALSRPRFVLDDLGRQTP